MSSDLSQFPLVKEPLVTVVLPVFNGGRFLEHAVRSIFDQTWSSWELLIFDDGSTVGAIDTIPFITDPRVLILRDGSNLGLSARLNQGIAMAKGKYIARMDHDDICHPERFLHQVTFLEDHPEVDLLSTQCVIIDERDRLRGALPAAINHSDICGRPWQGFYMPHPSWMGRTEWFRCNYYKNPAPYRCEDQELLLRAHYSSRYHTLPTILMAYRQHKRPRLSKLFKTRLAMWLFQIRIFMSRREWLNVILSTIMVFVRFGRDIGRDMLVKHCQSIGFFSVREKKAWFSIIGRIKY